MNAIFGESLEPREIADIDGLKAVLDNQLSNDPLTPREKRVLQLRFGLEDGQCRSLEQVASVTFRVGKEFKVTRERIRQIEGKALRKLRHPSRRRQTKTFI